MKNELTAQADFKSHIIPSRILIASDHAGFSLKNVIITELQDLDIQVLDLGCDDAQTSVDYPDYANQLCQELQSHDMGILICGSGVGISIAANRHNHVRAALCHNAEVAKLSRMHNDANVICCGARIISQEAAIESIKAFLTTEFEAGRHLKRVEKLSS